MLFNSYIFIFLFLPMALLGYFVLNHFKKFELAKFFLIAMSLWFYAYFNISYLWIILISMAVNYFCHVKILGASGEQSVKAKVYLAIGILFNLGLLFYFKYFNFFMDHIHYLFHTSYAVKQILLPLGISFFTFQQLGFLIDTARGEVDRQPILDYALFVTFFPQLIAGPIVSHDEMLPQFKDPALKHPDAANLYIGSRNFILGLAKKVLLADVFGQAVEWGYSNDQMMHGAGVAVLMVVYSFQLYFDFSGYCDMARGIGKMFNMELPVNFFSPYKSENFMDFWKRWHITLGRFLTKYLYIPLGGSRKGTVRTYINIFTIFLASGIWHGAGYTYMVWGMLHGVLNVINHVFRKYVKKFLTPGNRGILPRLRKALAIFLTYICFDITLIFFRAESLAQAFALLRQLFDFKAASGAMELAQFFILPEIEYVWKALHVPSSALVSLTPMLCFCLFSVLLIWGCKNVTETERQSQPTVLKCIMLAVLLCWSMIMFSGVSVFLYFNF